MPENLLPHSYHSFFFLYLPAVSAFPCSMCHFLYVTTIINSSIHFPLLCSHLSPHPGHVLPSLTDFLFVSPFLPPKQLPTPLLAPCYYVFFLTTVLHSVLGGDLQTSCGTLDEGGLDDNVDWEEEREMERLACEGDDFIPPKIMVKDCDI